MRILVVEDEYALADLISSRLKKEKYTVDVSLDGEDGLYNVLTDIYDLIILDIMLPKVDGIEILKEAKKNNIKTKIIMLTAKSELDDKLLGLNNGANDYLTKPFHMDKLIARVNVQLRNNTQELKTYLEYGDIRLNIKSSNVCCTKTGEEINIINKEFLLLEYFMNNPEQIISKEQIYDKIWGMDNDTFSNNLEVFLSFLRKKLKLIGSSVSIKAIRGMGYKLEYNDEEIKK